MMRTEAFEPIRNAVGENGEPLRLVFHGLRKNAVINLLQAGCTETHVSAIVNMNEAMVRHYGRRVNRSQLAVDAMKKMESNPDRVVILRRDRT